MHRNLDARVEMLAPIEHPALKRYLQFILNICLRDNNQRWIMKPNGKYKRVKRKKEERKISTHDVLMAHTKELTDPVPRASGTVKYTETF
jgi:polyphosphate kinase